MRENWPDATLPEPARPPGSLSASLSFAAFERSMEADGTAIAETFERSMEADGTAIAETFESANRWNRQRWKGWKPMNKYVIGVMKDERSRS